MSRLLPVLAFLPACASPLPLDALAGVGLLVFAGCSLVVADRALRRVRVAVAFLAVLAGSGCAPAYVTAGAIADGMRTALGAYELANHEQRRALLGSPEVKARCASVPEGEIAACFDGALFDFERSRLPVRACFAAAAPVVRAAALAAEAKDAKAAAAVLPDLISKSAMCAAEIKKASK